GAGRPHRDGDAGRRRRRDVAAEVPGAGRHGRGADRGDRLAPQPRGGPLTDALLDEVTVLAWLRSMDVIGDGPAGARLLAGGVSNVVIAVDAGVRRLIVKQALAQLRVQDRWEAPRERTIVEGAALELCGTITPDAVPEVLLCDEPTSTLV